MTQLRALHERFATPPRCLARRSRARGASRGVTLVEMLVVLAIVALLVSGVIMGSGQLGSAKLRKSVTTLAGAIRVAFTRASVMSRSVRLVFDLEQKQFWLEEADQPMLVQSNDATGTGGAEPLTDQERIAVAESDRIIKGVTAPKPRFHKVDMGLLAREEDKTPDARDLPSGIEFRSVQTPHDDEARTSGRAYLYFWPGGLTERASIVLRKGKSTDDGDAMTLVVSPLTGQVTAKPGAVALPAAIDDKDLSEREDRGSF